MVGLSAFAGPLPETRVPLGVVEPQLDADGVARQLDGVGPVGEVLGHDPGGKNRLSLDAQHRVLVDESFDQDGQRNCEQQDRKRGDGENRDQDAASHGNS